MNAGTKTLEFEAKPRLWGFWNWMTKTNGRFIILPAEADVTGFLTYRVTLTPVEPEPAPAPLCPVCGKPAGEHRDGLWCCGHCRGRVKVFKTNYNGWDCWTSMCYSCGSCGPRRSTEADAIEAMNRRA